VSATNFSGKEIPATVNVHIYPLHAPQKIYRKRYWQQPDMYVMKKDEFEKYFPYDEYENETQYQSWQKENAVVSAMAHTDSSGRINLQSRLQQGLYVVEAISKDKDGIEVKDIAYIELYDNTSASLPYAQINWSKNISTVVQPGEKARMLVGTSDENVFLYRLQNEISIPVHIMNTIIFS